jgi:hypothetical protein
MCYIEDPLVVISIRSGSWKVNIYNASCRNLGSYKVALKGEIGSGMGERVKQYGSCCFCGPCVCLGIFLLL